MEKKVNKVYTIYIDVYTLYIINIVCAFVCIYYLSGWWFGTFFIFPFSWEFHHPNWLSYFSEGLKPPTSIIYIYIYIYIFTVASRRKPPAPSVMDSGSLICWRMFGHIERFFSTYWALFSSVWGYLGPILGYVGPIWGYVGPMWAYRRLMLGLCWAYLDPFLAYIGPDQEFWPLLKDMQKHEQKWGPPHSSAY